MLFDWSIDIEQIMDMHYYATVHSNAQLSRKEILQMTAIKNIAKNIGAIALSIIVLVIGSLAQGATELLFSNYYLHLIIPALVRIALTVFLGWIVSSKILKIDAKELGLKIKKIDVKRVLISVALPVLVLVFYACILQGKAYVAKPGEFWKSLVTALFGVGITAGICEELIFRGMIFRYMKKTLGTKAAVIIPALLFACTHIMNMETFNLADLILLILAGSSVAVMFALFALESDSIYPGAFAHTLWNTLIIGGLFGIGEIVNGLSNDSYIVIPINSTSKLLTGGNFGVEAALPAIVGYILAALLTAFLYKRRNKESITNLRY